MCSDNSEHDSGTAGLSVSAGGVYREKKTRVANERGKLVTNTIVRRVRDDGTLGGEEPSRFVVQKLGQESIESTR